MATDDAKEWLMEIKGVGPKTASVVLNFHFGKPTMAVDTHVERVSKRFGLVPESASNQAAHDALDKLVPDELIYPLHVLLIRHGRERCSARGADCDNPVRALLRLRVLRVSTSPYSRSADTGGQSCTR